MDQQAIVDVVCKTGVENLSVEIGALLGQDLTCSDVQLQVISKETLFSDPQREKTALTRMSVSGDQEGDCYLLTRIDAAILLGGTLIMLPEDMIEEHIQNNNLDGELIDAFGEVANIIAGVFTQAFVDKYSKSIRFIKNSVEELVPTKIDLASSEPFATGNYYVASCTVTVGEKNLGPVEFVVPAAIFELEEAAPEESPEPAAAPVKDVEENVEPAAEPVAAIEPASEPVPEQPATPVKPSFTDAKKLTDVVFTATINQIGEEIGALLGQNLVCDDIKLLVTSKEEFFANHCLEKSNLAHLQVSGDREGLGFMFTQIPDAVVLGGTLIMLPEEQINEQKDQGELNGEVADAFGEVANILAGGLTQVFLDRHPQQLRFVRTESELLVPKNVDLESDKPFVEGPYYLASFAIHLEGHELNRIQLLFPGEIFDLDGSEEEIAQSAQVETVEAVAPAVAAASAEAIADRPTAPQASGASPTEQPAAANTKVVPIATGPPVVLIISENKTDAVPFTEILSAVDYNCEVLTFQEDIKNLIQENQVLGAFLIMSQVGEKGFATAIKLQSTDQPLPPLIFAGPEWTRSEVLRAVKYGAKDILVMPASNDEIQEKVSQHILKAS